MPLHHDDRITPEELADIAYKFKDRGNIGVAYTYNEPLVSYEFVRDSAKLVKAKGMKNVLVTNGTAELPILEEILPYIDLKDATKHILYNKANSNCVQGISPSASIWYDMSPWKGALIAVWVVVGLLAIADGVFITLIALDKVKVKERKEPEEEY